MVVFNPLNIEREDVVEATVNFPEGMPAAVRVTDPDGRDVPSQISDGKVLFTARLKPVGYAVYNVQPASFGGEGERCEFRRIRSKINTIE